jgi:hypothetical protein
VVRKLCGLSRNQTKGEEHLSDYLSDYDRSIHSNPDAQAWAKFFIKTVKEQGWKIEHIDEGLMHGWFANAMMAMHDHIKREWVGLSAAETENITSGSVTLLKVALETEAKLKEKNHE